jgi:ankyrin repeat protein
MSVEKNNPIRLWLKIVPLLLIVSLFGWCSSNGRKAAQLAPVRVELQNFFMEQGLVGGNDKSTSLADMTKTLDGQAMNDLFYEAASSVSLEALKWLVAHGADPKNVGARKNLTLLQVTARLPRLDRLEYMLGFGLDPLERCSDGRGVLHLAAQGGLDAQVLKLLQSKGLNVTDTDHAGRTPMHFASLKSIPVLVAAGAEIDAPDNMGMSALHQAAKEGRNDAVTELLRNSASVFAKDKKGRMPLHYAAMARGGDAVIEALLAAGAPVTARDDEGLTPKDLALESRENSRYGSVLDKL